MSLDIQNSTSKSTNIQKPPKTTSQNYHSLGMETAKRTSFSFTVINLVAIIFVYLSALSVAQSDINVGLAVVSILQSRKLSNNN